MDELLSVYDRITDGCFELFQAKNHDYGPTWLLYRYSSLNDEIWRKAKRIRTLEENGDRALVDEGRDVEYVGIINYCIMFLIRLSGILPDTDSIVGNLQLFDLIDAEKLYDAYRKIVLDIRGLLIRKNTDYGDAWKSMGITAMTDQIIVRVYRIKKILANGEKLLASEGVSSQLNDIINYCVFALIKMKAEITGL